MNSTPNSDGTKKLTWFEATQEITLTDVAKPVAQNQVETEKKSKNQTDARIVKKRKKVIDTSADCSITIKVTAEEKQKFWDACGETNQVPLKVLRDLMVKYSTVIEEQK